MDGLEEFRERARAAVAEIVVPRLAEWESNGLDRTLFRDLAQRGLLAPTLPLGLGGCGGTLAHSAALVAEFMREFAVGPAVSVLVQANTVFPLIARLGRAEPQQELLRRGIQGEQVGCLGATEPAGGSDLIGAITSSAANYNGEWRLNGTKEYITNAPIADFGCLLVRTDSMGGPFSLTLFLTPFDGSDVSVSTLSTVGLRSSPTGKIVLDGAVVDSNAVLGRPGRGYVEVARVLAQERVLIGIGAIALAQRCWEKTCEYMQIRTSGGITLSRHQALRYELAQIATELAAGDAHANSLVERASVGHLDSGSASIAKFRLCELAQKGIRRCIHFHGAHGWTEDTWMDQVLRDSRVLSIFAGASEVMRDMVAARVIARSRADTAASAGVT